MRRAPACEPTRRSWRLRGALVGALVLTVVGATHVGASTDEQVTRAPAVVATVGSVDVEAPHAGTLTVSVPVTLNRPAPAKELLGYSVIAGSAVAGRDLVAQSGTVTLQRAAVEASVPVTVLSDAVPATSSCWYQGATACRTFGVSLTPLSKGVAVGRAPSESAILWAPASQGLAVGDGLVVTGVAGRTRTLRIPVALSAPSSKPVSVSFQVKGESALAGLNVATSHGTLHFGGGVQLRNVVVTVLDGHDTQPDEVLHVTLSSPHGAAIVRSVGTGILATDAVGVAAPLAANLSSSVLTQTVSATTGAADTYAISDEGTTTHVAANGTILGANDRVVFWPTDEAPSTDQEACSTWSSQTPAQGVGVITQQGLALRVATNDGITRAITVTKNEFDNVYYDLNVHVWNTSWSTPFHLVQQFDLIPLFEANDRPDLPWNVCARAVGTTVQVELWFPGEAPPPWGNTDHGGTAQLPAGWDYPGESGWYAGHLATHASLVDTNQSEGPPEPTPSV